MNNQPTYTLEFPDCKGVVVCGDIHGDFNLLVNKVCVQYEMRDTLIIVAGDCGFGFEKKGYYENIVRRNAKRMNEAGNTLLFIRGNHDNPAYFDGKEFCHKRFMAIPDYTIVKACGHTILCVGGAISIDRQYRKESWTHAQKKMRHYGHQSEESDPLATNYYWPNEMPVYDSEALQKLSDENKVDTVITHTAPSFCELQSKDGLLSWAANDAELITDVEQERKVMDAIYTHLKQAGHPVTHWCYGHYHQSWHSSIEGILFKMLDIMELYTIP